MRDAGDDNTTEAGLHNRLVLNNSYTYRVTITQRIQPYGADAVAL